MSDVLIAARQPTFFIPHGGGPCFFMDDPHGIWTSMAAFLRDLPSRLPETPRAILLVSGHWETDGFAFTGSAAPSLVYDYYNFPPHTYQLTYPVPGDPALAGRAARLLAGAGIKAAVDPERGLDHGAFIPLKVAFPDADVPVVEMSVDRTLDPALHMAAGRALAPLRDEGVLILGSGMSFHNMRAYGDPRAQELSAHFDRWLTDVATAPAADRDAGLSRWRVAPGGAFSHPREEHLIPLMVAAAAAEGAGEHVYGDEVLSVRVSGYRFD